MNRIVILGDIHGRTIWKQIVEKEQDANKIVFIGDYFDTHEDIDNIQQLSNFKEIIEYKRQNFDKIVLLTGNHDFHYLPTSTQTYSGYQHWSKTDFGEVLSQAIKDDMLRMCFKYADCVKYIGEIGHNPFPEKNWNSRIRITGYDLGNMVSICGYDRRERKFKNETFGEVIIPELNWEPTIKDKDGNDIKYQRELCWTTKDKQLLIESIYNQLDIGKIVVRKRSYKWVENRVKKGQIEGTAFRDIVDGKQRLNAILDFMQNKYPDLNGYFYDDLSRRAQYKFDNFSAYAFCEMEEEATDEDVQSVFLNVNFTGRPMSPEHIEFVKSIKIK